MDYAILTDRESGIFQVIILQKNNPEEFIDELCAFYVAFIRAEKEVFYTARIIAYGPKKGEIKHSL